MRKTRREKSRKWAARGMHIGAYATFILCPISAVVAKFPLWKEQGGLMASLGVGSLVISVIVAFTLRNFFADWIRRRFGGFAWDQSKFWIGGTIVLLVLNMIGNIISDLLTVWLAGTCGMLVGTILLVLEKKVKVDDGQGTDEDE